MRKDPGLRLRFAGSASSSAYEFETLQRAIEAALETLTVEGAVAHSFASVYEPEVFFLGGPASLELLHRYFDADTSAWMDWEAAHERVRPPFAGAVLSLGVLSDLFRRCVGAPEEIWDVWCNVARIYGPPAAPLDAPPIDLHGLARIGGARATLLIERYAAANTALADGLDETWRSGQLAVGRRALLPTVAAFLWNRHRVKAQTISRLAQAMTAALDPRRGLIGVTPATPPEPRA